VTNVYNISPEGKVFEEASLWVSKLDRGLSLEEQVSLDQWLSKSDRNRLALIKVGQVWDKSEVLSKLADLFPEPVENHPARSWALPAIAASVAIIALSIWFAIPEFSPAESRSDLAQANVEGLYQTAIGEHIRVNLPDGTELLLNTNTTVRVNYSDQQRLLTLEKGELHVDVAHDENRPLSVLVGGQIVQAVGTAFNVELNADRKVDLVVTEGKVLVSVQSAGLFNPVVQMQDRIEMPSTSLTVTQGERVLLGERQEEVELMEVIEPSEIEILLSWQSGNLVFRGESLEEAIQEISRYTAVEFVFLNEDLKQLKVAGLFQTGDVDGLLVALNDNFHIDSQRIDQRVLLNNR
jgi:transmembrane sensor